MFTLPRYVRILPIAAGLVTMLAACTDNVVPTAPLAIHRSFTQLTNGPVVNSLADPGDGTCDDTQCTLREAIAFASSGAMITFNVTGTIALTSSLTLSNPVTISGPGADQLSVSGNGVTQVFSNNATGSIISGITITGGYVTAGGGAGLTNYGTLTLIDCALTGNNAYFAQGGAIRNSGTIHVISSTLSNNTGHYSASGFANNGTAVFVNSTVSGSLASGGGLGIGVYNGSGTLRLISSTVSGNSYGVHTYTTGTTEIKNSLVWGNTVYDVAEYSNGITTSLGYNLVGITNSTALTTEFSNTGDQAGVTDAHIGALLVNSPGHTATYALLSGSTAIDAGSCTDNLGATIAADQRGVTRPQGSACDIGAYELTVSGATTPEFVFSLASLPPHSFGEAPFSVASYATTNSTGAITFATGSTSDGCSVSSAGLVTITGAAIDETACFIEATLAADATYTSAGPISQSFQIARAAGSVSINNIPGSATVGGNFTPTYTKSGNGTASTASNSPSVCTVESGVVSFVTTGTCLLQASITQGTNYLAATGSEQNFTISLVTPTFSFDLSGLSSKAFGDETFNVASHATTNSTGAITFGLGAGSVGCSVTSAGMVTVTGAAVDPVHCVLSASLAADGTFAAAGPVKDSVNIAKATSSVNINNMPASATVGDSFTPTYTTSSDGTVSVASLTTGVCTVTSGVVNFIAAGTCTLRASVTEGTNHLAVTGSQQNVTVSPLPAVFSSSCTYTINAKNNQRQVTVSWQNADPGVTQIQIADGKIVTRQLAPTATGSWSTNVKTGAPTYGLWGGTSRRANTTTLVDAGTACVQQ
jgi:hypothetical protein